uniref:Alpha-methylacyl-CoA racemase n=1 Tax=Glossina austeni TaxID=7395 RepID=A0A1A9V7D9_GLOAU
MNNGKRVFATNLKKSVGQNLVHRLAKTQDVLMKPFRPGVMEKLNLDPELLCRDNPRLMYARLTAFGQSGPLSARAGHDISYAAISGVLSMLGRENEKPLPPINILPDFAGESLMRALGICLALLECHRSGREQVVDPSSQGTCNHLTFEQQQGGVFDLIRITPQLHLLLQLFFLSPWYSII